jgi:hypothetical protein
LLVSPAKRTSNGVNNGGVSTDTVAVGSVAGTRSRKESCFHGQERFSFNGNCNASKEGTLITNNNNKTEKASQSDVKMCVFILFCLSTSCASCLVYRIVPYGISCIYTAYGSLSQAIAEMERVYRVRIVPANSRWMMLAIVAISKEKAGTLPGLCFFQIYYM